jgi:LacI family transcriptional regulator
VSPQQVTSHDVARLAGVSQPTVSRALRGDARLSAETIRRVQGAAELLHYVPSRRGRSLSTRSSGQIGIVVSTLRNSFYLEVLDALHTALRRVERRMLVLTPDAHDQIEIEELVDGALDGVILTTTMLDSTLPHELARRGFPFALLNREIDHCPGDVCVADNFGGARLVAEELLALGHTRIAAIFGPQNTSTGRDRELGFTQALAAADLDLPDERWRRVPFDFDSGHRAALELLDATDDPPTALFCANDMIALGAFNAVHGRGLRIPEDLTLIGFDDVMLASWETFALTTVSQNIEGMVEAATDLLLARIASADGPSLPPRRLVLPAELRRRRTHGPPRM